MSEIKSEPLIDDPRIKIPRRINKQDSRAKQAYDKDVGMLNSEIRRLKLEIKKLKLDKKKAKLTLKQAV